MNKFAVSLGLVALGTTALHAVEATAVNGLQRTKPWSVAASLRGFYDDNINTTPTKQGSAGFEITPSVDFGMIGDQTSFNLGYQFSARYYDTRPAGQSDNWQFDNIFDGAFAHAFNPRVNVIVRDSFIMGQDPGLLRAGDQPLGEPQSVPGNNIINYGTIAFDIEVTELLGLNVGYANSYYNYAQDGAILVPGPAINPSPAGVLNRIENRVNLDTMWKLRPQTVGILGYTYGQDLYTGDEPILIDNTGIIVSDDKNSRSHTFYVGAQHTFNPAMSGLLKVGAQYYDYYNDPTKTAQWSPYVLANLRYMFQAQTTADVGFSYQRSAADVSGNDTSGYVLDTETALCYGSLSHEIVAHLVGTARGTVQYSTYNGGGFNDQSYLFFQIGLDLAYEFTKNLSAHVGYNFDDNDSDIPGQSYNRNRVYLGVTAAY